MYILNPTLFLGSLYNVFQEEMSYSCRNCFCIFFRKMLEKLLNFVKSLLLSERSFWSWLNCVPTLHYIEDRYRPFETAPGSANHRDRKPVWWGIDSFNFELKTFKGRSSALRFFLDIYFPQRHHF